MRRRHDELNGLHPWLWQEKQQAERSQLQVKGMSIQENNNLANQFLLEENQSPIHEPSQVVTNRPSMNALKKKKKDKTGMPLENKHSTFHLDLKL